MAFDNYFDISSLIKDSRFNFSKDGAGLELGKGAWGTVYSVYDTEFNRESAVKVLTPSDVALEQLEMRGRTLDDVLKAEADLSRGSRHIVPREFKIDSQTNTRFLLLPRYNEFLDSYLNDHDTENRKSVKSKDINFRGTLNLLRDMSHGLADLHSDTGRAHGDVKPDNFALRGSDNDLEALVNDLGSCTTDAYDLRKGGNWENAGPIFTRAPEMFKEYAHPSFRSDIWSLGSVMYRMFTGEYILENEINELVESNGDIASFMGDTKKVQSIIDKKISQAVPFNYRKTRSLLRNMLNTDSRSRKGDMREVQKQIEKIISDTPFKKANQVGAATLLAGALTGATFYKLPDSTPHFNMSGGTSTITSFDPEGEPVRLKIDEETLKSFSLNEQYRRLEEEGDGLNYVPALTKTINTITNGDDGIVSYLMHQFPISREEAYSGGAGAYMSTTWSLGGARNDECKERAEQRREEGRSLVERAFTKPLDEQYPSLYCTYYIDGAYGSNPDIFYSILEEGLQEGLEYAQQKEEIEHQGSYRSSGGVSPRVVNLEDVLTIALEGVDDFEKARDVAYKDRLERVTLEQDNFVQTARDHSRYILENNLSKDETIDYVMERGYGYTRGFYEDKTIEEISSKIVERAESERDYQLRRATEDFISFDDYREAEDEKGRRILSMNTTTVVSYWARTAMGNSSGNISLSR